MNLEKINKAVERIKKLYKAEVTDVSEFTGFTYYSCRLKTNYGNFRFSIQDNKLDKPFIFELDCEAGDYSAVKNAIKKLTKE